MENIKEYVEKFTTFGRPVEYKGLKIKPILVEDAMEFLDIYTILLFEKNKIPDIKVIQMSYLHFLFTYLLNDKELYDKFLRLMELCLGLNFSSDNMIESKFEPDEFLFKEGENGNQIFFVNGRDIAFEVKDEQVTVSLGSTHLNSTEFDEFKKIILFQNIHGYNDMIMSDDFREIITQYYEIKNRGIKQPTLEDKMMAIIVNTAYTVETIQQIPLRTFEVLFGYSVGKIDYQSTMPLLPNLKSQPEHWVYKQDKERYSEIFSNAEELANKVTSI